jgi:hypothetical protein
MEEPEAAVHLAATHTTGEPVVAHLETPVLVAQQVATVEFLFRERMAAEVVLELAPDKQPAHLVAEEPAAWAHCRARMRMQTLEAVVAERGLLVLKSAAMVPQVS